MADTPQAPGTDLHTAPNAAGGGSGAADLVTVVIPCYNAAGFVGEAVASVLAQSHPAVEVVVVDDASTDGSRGVVAAFGERVTLLRLPANGGPTHARNRGVELAHGEWLLFMDADDLIEPDTVAGLVEAARRAPGSLAACPWEFLNEQEGGGWVARPPGRPFAPTGDPLAGWLAGIWAPPCAVLFPRGVYLAAGGFDEVLRRNDDGDLAMRAFVDGAGLALATRGKGFYRRQLGPRSLTTDDRSGAGLRSQLRVLDKLVPLLEARGRLDEYRPLIEVQYGHVANHAFRVGDLAVARASLAHGGSGAAEVVRSRTLAGRLLTAAVGLERKHRIVRVLRRWGAALRPRPRVAARPRAVRLGDARGSHSHFPDAYV